MPKVAPNGQGLCVNGNAKPPEMNASTLDCISGGREQDFCSLGYGQCCNTAINTATVTCDVDECCPDGGDCDLGCYDVKRGGLRTTRLLQRQYSTRVPLQASCDKRLHRVAAKLSFQMLMDDKLDFWSGMLVARSDDRK